MSKKHKKNRNHVQQEAPVQQQAYTPAAVKMQTHFDPMGASHQIQHAITDLLHRLTLDDGRFTLAELGYLHMNTLWFNQEAQSIELRAYFDARLCCRKKMSAATQEYLIEPVDELNVFRNYFFYGQLQDCISFEKILAPKYEVVEDKYKRASIQFKRGHKQEEITALVLHGCFPLAMAAILDLNLFDPNFDIKVHPVAVGSNSAVDSIVQSVNTRLVPIGVDVTYSGRTEVTSTNCYDPDLAEAYLASLMDTADRAEEVRAEVVEKVTKKVKKEKKRAATVAKGFSDFA